MEITKQTKSRTWIAYTAKEQQELSLKLPNGFQIWHNMYDGALRYMMQVKGFTLEQAVRFILVDVKDTSVPPFTFVCRLNRLWKART